MFHFIIKGGFMFSFVQKRLIVLIVLLCILLLISCNSDDSDNENNNNSNQSFVDTIPFASNSDNGNFNVLNTSSDNFIIADSKVFFDSTFIKKINSGTTSVMINISNLGGVKRFFAIKEDVLRKYETTKDIPETEIITSINFDTNFGGTWNPFGAPTSVNKKGAIFINNYTDSILFVIPENQNNSPEGRINRGQKNVKVPFLIGTNYVYFIDVSTGSLIDYQEVFVSYQSSPYINVGKPDSLPEDPGILQIFNNTNKIYTVQNMMTDQYLINNDCNCTDIGPSTTGIFEITPGIIQLKLTNSNSFSITSEIFNVSENQTINLTIQNNTISINNNKENNTSTDDPSDNPVYYQDKQFLDLSEYTVGDIPNELGYSLIVQNESGRKCISSLNGNGRIELTSLNLRESFELTIEVDFTNFNSAFILRSTEGNEILVNFQDSYISFGDFSFNWNDTGWKGENNINICKLLIANGICKFFINNKYFGSIITNSTNIYNYFTITGINEDDYIYAIEYININISEINHNDIIIRNITQGFSLNLTLFEVGDLPTFLGSNILIHERNTIKHITSMPDTNANLIIDQITLQSNFELIYNADWTDSSVKVLLKSSNHRIEIYHDNRDITFGAKSLDWNSTGWKGNDFVNECRLSVSSGTGKFYINNEFFGSIVVPDNEQYKTLYLSGIQQKDALFSLTGRNF